ncbi:hypothetical protein ACTZWT_02510 [Rhodopseudomonas sp. NSM]|uniref:hypothetical protein n=1 Tax=Rhodopseudomonas sp. NSM TaxID=3457630 RepID=UPI0040351C05
MDMLSTDHMKARDAVRHVLIAPDSAQFSALRSVERGPDRYVCGAVRARDKAGHFAEAAFVYVRAIDFARLDDEGRITHRRSEYRPCPVPEEEIVAELRPPISPAALAAAKMIQQLVPPVDPSALASPSTLARLAGGAQSGGTLEHDVRRLSKTLSASSGLIGPPQVGPPIDLSRVAGSVSPVDQPPAAWPIFPPDHPLSKPPRTRAPSEALSLAKDVAQRWEQSEALRDPALQPAPDEIEEACRALLAIDPKGANYASAWAFFVRLRQLDPERRHDQGKSIPARPASASQRAPVP